MSSLTPSAFGRPYSPKRSSGASGGLNRGSERLPAVGIAVADELDAAAAVDATLRLHFV